MATAPSQNVLGANERIGIGLIGYGKWCDTLLWPAHLTYFTREVRNCEVVAVADECNVHRKEAPGFFGSTDCALYEDHRDLLQDRRVDAVICNTEDFRHAPVILDALAAGKHILTALPLTRYLPEAFEIWDACKKSDKIFQVGAYECQFPAYQKAAELIRAGAIGPVVAAETSYTRNIRRGEWNMTIPSWASKEKFDWAKWTRQVPGAPAAYSDEDFFRWQKYYRYSSGLLGRYLSGRLHSALMVLGNPGFPLRVAALGSHAIDTDAATKDAGKRDTPSFIQVLAELPGGINFRMSASTVNESAHPDTIRGQQATLLFTGSTIKLIPEPAFHPNRPEETFGKFPYEGGRGHLLNWFESIHGRAKPSCGIELAIRAQVLLCMAEMSDRFKVMCYFDEKKRKVTDGNGREICLAREPA